MLNRAAIEQFKAKQFATRWLDADAEPPAARGVKPMPLERRRYLNSNSSE